MLKPARILLTAALAYIVLMASYSEAQKDTYLWPVEGHLALTGTFGEFRYSHFHTGIDVSTNGVTGAPLRAIDDGFVYRIKTSPGGYGRAIYLRLHDGNIAVYGHLSRFTSSVTQRVREEQHRVSDFTIDYYPRAEDFPVKRGDLIGYSGDTGGVSPHLHFELRTSENRPVNPLIHLDSTPTDGTKPKITAVALNPIGIDSSVEEGWETRTYSTQWNKKKNIYTVPYPIRVWGECGVEVNAHDISPRGYHTGVYGLDLFVNDQLVSALRYDTVTYDEYRDNYVVVNRKLYLEQNKSFQRFCQGGSPVLPFYRVKEGTSGVLTSFQPGLPGSLHRGLNEVKIVAEDHAKKQCTVHLQLLVEEPFYNNPALLSSGIANTALDDKNIAKVIKSHVQLIDDFLIVEATVTDPHTASLQCFVRQTGADEATIPLHLRPPKTLVGRYALLPHHDGIAVVQLVAVSPDGTKRETSHEVVLQTVAPDRGGVVKSTDGVISITFKPGSVPLTIFPQVRQGPVTKSPKFLKPESDSYRFTPLEASFRSKGTIAMGLAEGRSQQVALFYRDKGNWRYLGCSENTDSKKNCCFSTLFCRIRPFQ